MKDSREGEKTAADSRGLRALQFLMLLGGGAVLCYAAGMTLDWRSQVVFALLTLATAAVLRRSSRSQLVTLTLVMLSIYSTLRYAIWRVETVADYVRGGGTERGGVELVFICVLLLAECYAFGTLLLGYMQTLWPLRRRPVEMPADPEEWPAVDVLIPTLNEPLSMVRFTVLAAMNIDWPAEKLNVYLLDDGDREEFRAFAQEAGVGYISRRDNLHAKAGNINHALGEVNSAYVAVFDCDHVPTRSFLQMTMGLFLRDAKLAVVQTPQRFYSPDPFERNLNHFATTPGEDELFYGVVQDGNDFWNAAFFCGSCAVLRRSALDDVGGMRVETVTEDAHTSLRMQMRGWNSAYLNIPQAAGLACERLSGHVRQRVRWARGMVQILRLENPLFARGLTAAQRLCYFNAMSHFLYSLPRLIFLTAPTMYLIFGVRNMPGYWVAIVAYAVPHLLLASVVHSRIQGRYRHTFWNEIFETVLAPYILLPTLFALVNPKRGRFNVTAKGGVVGQGFFDARIARPFVLLATVNFAALLLAVPRLIAFPRMGGAGWTWIGEWLGSMYDAGHAGTVGVNAAWAAFNLTILGVAIAVARESLQRREAARVAVAVASDVILADGSMVQGTTSDISGSGIRTRVAGGVKAKTGDAIEFVFRVGEGSVTLPAVAVAIDGTDLRARFDVLSLEQMEALTEILYSRADAWLALGGSHEEDRPLRSLGRIVRLSAGGLKQAVMGQPSGKPEGKSKLAAGIVPVLFLLGIVSAARLSGQSTVAGSASGLQLAQFHDTFSLRDAGVAGDIELKGAGAEHAIRFLMARNELVTTATMHLRYRASPGLMPAASHLSVSLNGTLVATLPVKADGSGPVEAAVALPPDLLVHDNQLEFELNGQSAQCDPATNSKGWVKLDGATTIEAAGSLLPLANDLKTLPLPFLNDGEGNGAVVQIDFPAPPSSRALQAAGIVASWLGVLNGSHTLRFAVTVGAAPAGNAIVIAEDASGIPTAYGVTAVAGPTVAMVANPADAYSNLLVITGSGGDDLVNAATALALHRDPWEGTQVSVRDVVAPAVRGVDDAPRWIRADGGRTGAADATDLESDGSDAVSLYLRLPPDLSFGQRQNLDFHLKYRYSSAAVGAWSKLQMYVNGAFVSSTPLAHTDLASSVAEVVIRVPVADLRPFSNTVTFKFDLEAMASYGCLDGAGPKIEGAVLKDSYLDISGLAHSAALPDLELFANAGYPFTRMADLADTTVVLPVRPSAAEVELYLALMGHFGTQTGYPVLRVSVTDATGMTADGGKDYLVLGSAADQPGLKMLDGALPVEEDGAQVRVHDAKGFFERSAWWKGHRTDNAGLGTLETQGGLPEALVEGMEWPARSGRTVVAIALRDDSAVANFVTAFLAKSQASEIAQSVSVLRGDSFLSYRIGVDSYRFGRITWTARLETLFQNAPWLIALVTVLFCFVMAAAIQGMLRRRVADRLRLGHH